jgi:hypothetical protein
VGVAYDVEDGPVRVGGELVLGCVSDKTLVIGEGYPRRCDTVTWRPPVSMHLVGEVQFAVTYPGRW